MIAGHTFGADGKCSCGKRLVDLAPYAYGKEWIDKPDIAHSGDFRDYEQSEVAAALEAIFAHVVGCATGSGPTVSPPPEIPLHDDAYIG